MTGKQLTLARNLLGLNQTQLGERLGMNVSSINKMERGERRIRRATELAVKFLLVEEAWSADILEGRG